MVESKEKCILPDVDCNWGVERGGFGKHGGARLHKLLGE